MAADELEGAPDVQNELSFLQAAQTFRAARASGDAEQIKSAEDAWREQVRREIIESMNVR